MACIPELVIGSIDLGLQKAATHKRGAGQRMLQLDELERLLATYTQVTTLPDVAPLRREMGAEGVAPFPADAPSLSSPSRAGGTIAGSAAERLEVVRFLRNGGSLDDLARPPVAVTSKRHRDLPNLVCLHYSQTVSRPCQIVRECRGLILDEDQDWRPVCCPYFRFDNFDKHKHTVTAEAWAVAKVYKKLDGTLVNLYHFAGQWRVGTTSTADAVGIVAKICQSGLREGDEDYVGSYNEFFWQVWHQLGYSMPTDENMCYMFELQSPNNQIIVPVDRPRLTLHGARRMDTLEEVAPEPIAAAQGWALVEQVQFESMQDVLDSASNLPVDEEGYVVVLPGYQRYKVKGPKYVLASHLPGVGCSNGDRVDEAITDNRHMMTVVLRGEVPEFSAAFPQVREALQAVEAELASIVAYVEEAMTQVAQEAAPRHEEAFFGRAAKAMKARRMNSFMMGLAFTVWRGKAADVRSAMSQLKGEHAWDALREAARMVAQSTSANL